jgi:ribosomal-protein-alanine N-acetyltransferase
MPLNAMETSRLLIRPIELGDAGFLFFLVNSPWWLHYIGDRNVGDENQAKTYIERIQNTPDFEYMTVTLKEENIPIGVVSLIKRTEYEYPDIGYALLPLYMKQGYAYEATSSLVKQVWASGITTCLLAITKPDNLSSLRLLEKLGFSRGESYNDDLAIYRFFGNSI